MLFRSLLDSKLTRLELREGEVSLSGPMKALPGLSRPGVLVFTNNLSGTDSSGVQVWVRCLAWVTNASGATRIKSTNDVTGVLLQGTLEIPGRSTNDVEHGYAP